MKFQIYRVNKILVERERHFLILVTSFTFLIKLSFVLISYFTNEVTHTEYLYWGQQFAEGHWIEPRELTSGMIIAPLLPVMVTLCTKLFSDFAVPLYVYNALITSLVVPVLYFIAKELFNKGTALMISLWGVFFPEFFKYSPYILKESTVFFLLPLIVLLLLKSIRETQKERYVIYAAITFTILIHTDERFIFYLPFFALIFFFIKPLNFKTLLKSWTLWFGIIILLGIPWGIRNYKVYDQVVLISPRTTAFTSYLWGKKITHLEYNSYEDVLARNKERYGHRFEEYYKHRTDIAPREYSKAEVKIKAFINFWQPAYFKPTFITYGYRFQKWSVAHNMASILFYGIFLPFYILGFLLLIKKRKFSGIFLASIPLIHSLLHAYMVSPLERYRSPVTFIIVVTGIWAISIFSEKVNWKFNMKKLRI